ncbi:MAG: CHAP domain-containing protein [Flammeovirgaceae bacterium]
MTKNIVEIARSYLGQMEKHNNSGFVDGIFEKKMQNVGFYKSAPWCGFFCRLIWTEAGLSITHMLNKRKRTIVTSSAVKSMKAASECGRWSATPEIGSVAVWRTFKKGVPQSTGHMAVVIGVNADSFQTIEGNTNANGGREGNTVAEKLRSYSWYREDGLRLMGFISIK